MTAQTHPNPPSLNTVTLPIEGLNCASCVQRVEARLKKIDRVEAVSVNLATEMATITLTAPVNNIILIEAIKDAGYFVPQETRTFLIHGMKCGSCVQRIENALKKVASVTNATVNLATEQAAVTGNASAQEVLFALRTLGYTAQLLEEGASAKKTIAAKKEEQQQNLYQNLLISALLTLPLFLIEMGSHFIPIFHQFIVQTLGQELNWHLQFTLASLVLFGPGRNFLQQGLPALLKGAPDMNTLVMLGTLSAWGYSVIATFTPQLLPPKTINVYYEAVAVITTLILLGRFLEARAKGRTSQAIQKLLNLQTKTAHIERNHKQLEVPIEELRLTDIVKVRPGERIPVDGIILDGESYIDESMISGEPIPVAKQTGSNLIGGTINQTGALSFQPTALGEKTVLAQIIRMVEQAQSSKLPIQTLVDQVTRWFVPAVMVTALLTFTIWLIFGPSPALTFALVNAVSVLIIACPCAMGLATPTSIMIGTGRAAEMGVLFRKGEALQLLKDTKVVALDKTGTLTEGKPTLTDIDVLENYHPDDVLAAIAAVESHSEHPIAHAIIDAARQKNLSLPKVENFKSITGYGIEANSETHKIQVGADRYMTQLGLDLTIFSQTASRLSREGKTPLYAALGGKLVAILAVADPVRKEAKSFIKALHKHGLKVAMITGDNKHTAHAIAEQLNIDTVLAEVLPKGKVEAVLSLKEKYGTVTFVGDGINDAPALAEADVGIAIGTGTDIAIETADIVLMSHNLQTILTAISLSQATILNIQQNLFWAFAYNTALIPLATGALYPLLGLLLSPIFAAGAMALSSLFVLTNALRLRQFKAPVTATNIKRA